MKIVIRGKYLVVPIGSVREKKIVFRDKKGNVVFDFTAAVDSVNPKYYSYIHLGRFLKQEFEVTLEPETLFEYNFVDVLPADEPMSRRPLVHYTAGSGCLSEPSGLFYANGQYHMFYQYNPSSTAYGSMHWGHAVSNDLLHWTELEPALYPDKSGAMLAGSAYVDSENASQLRLKEEEPAPIVLYYTAAGGVNELAQNKSFTQGLAFSLDGGQSFRKYAGNPIVEHVQLHNRGPKVTWSPEIEKYVMALYLESNRYALYTSENLFTWKEFQTLTLSNDRGCPDFYPIEAANGERMWVFAGSQCCYTVGKLAEDGFTPIQSEHPFYFGTPRSLVGQTVTFTDSKECGSLYTRSIRMVYEKMHMPDEPFENQMGIPTEMSLVKTDNIYRLRAVPIREIEALYDVSETVDKISLSEPYRISLASCAYDVSLRSARNTGRYTITLFGITLKVMTDKNLLVIEDLASPIKDMPLSYTGGDVRIRLLVDTAGIELFADDGLIFSFADVNADFSMPYLLLASDENAVIDEITVHSLKPIR